MFDTQNERNLLVGQKQSSGSLESVDLDDDPTILSLKRSQQLLNNSLTTSEDTLRELKDQGKRIRESGT